MPSPAKLIANELAERLSRWDLPHSVGDQPEYQAWLVSRFPHWPYAEDFSRLNVPSGAAGCSVFSKDDMECLYWFSPEGVMNTPEGFTSGGLLTVGASPCGDMLVIDTRADADLEMGFVSHELLWEEEDSEADPTAVRAVYHTWPESLFEYLDHIHEDPESAH